MSPNEERKGPAIPVSAEKVSEYLESWMLEEIKGRSSRYFDLGKFFFTVSTGVVLFFLTALKVIGFHPCSLSWIAVCVVSSVLGVVASILLVWPQNGKIGSEFDVLVEYNGVMKRYRSIMIFWTITTIIALFGGFGSLFKLNFWLFSCD